MRTPAAAAAAALLHVVRGSIGFHAQCGRAIGKLV
jgi:hypothetical protein